MGNKTKIILPLVFVMLFVVCFFQKQTVIAQRSNDDTLKRQNKLLLKHFGFELPKTAKITNKLVTKDSKVTYIFIQMPASDLERFETTALGNVTTLNRKFDSGQFIGWLPDSDLADEPEDFIDNWTKNNQLNLGVLGRIMTTSGKLKYAVLFVDKKGFLLVKYKK